MFVLCSTNSPKEHQDGGLLCVNGEDGIKIIPKIIPISATNYILHKWIWHYHKKGHLNYEKCSQTLYNG